MLLLVLLTIAVVAIGLRLRRTPDIGGVDRQESSGGHVAVRSTVSKKLATASAKPVLSISMQTRRTADGKEQSTETITVDGQSYASIDEIPPEVRDRVRSLLAKARKPGADPAIGADAALSKIENDLAALGLDVRNAEGPDGGPAGRS